jgi:hypothetical protein
LTPLVIDLCNLTHCVGVFNQLDFGFGVGHDLSSLLPRYSEP